ncbi:hypothetical protein BS47DRAFT_1407882 [Hydnum rufescens UP504]|uniref:Uncharacterized protein n=1 Tax=Hydnum rufescens UP504 TaxID=1448309 RepID=A0A9P6AR34_9AGAM|nr:hypothetical protein BS47DRAFT_1407882 [Hydnum rufescens UP504]
MDYGGNIPGGYSYYPPEAFPRTIVRIEPSIGAISSGNFQVITVFSQALADRHPRFTACIQIHSTDVRDPIHEAAGLVDLLEDYVHVFLFTPAWCTHPLYYQTILSIEKYNTAIGTPEMQSESEGLSLTKWGESRQQKMGSIRVR